jgi:hypothetical protein
MSRFLKFFIIAVVSLVAILIPAIAPITAQSNANSIPTTTVQFRGHSVQVPDWNRITFNTMPPILAGGSVNLPESEIQQIGYNPNRTWQAGDRPATFMLLGDFEEAFGLQQFKPQKISQITGQDTLSAPLNRYSLMNWQTANTLVQAIPSLANLALNQVPPLQTLFRAAFGTVGDAIANNPSLANTPLSDVLDLANFNLEDIPGADLTAISEFAQWQQSPVAGVPGLGDVPFTQFPIPISTEISEIAIADVMFGSLERADPKAIAALDYISGTMEPHSGATTIPVPPEPLKSTRYVELADLAGTNGANQGKRWVAGNDQQVDGGYGSLRSLSNGKEPTGKAVWPRIFKVVLLETNEGQGAADFGIYFRVCVHTPFMDSCSPYIIGPVPWIPARETEMVILGVQGSGNTDTGLANASSPGSPSGTASVSEVSEEPNSDSPSTPDCTAILKNSINGPTVVGETKILASFTPGQSYTLEQAAKICGVTAFNWQQFIHEWPLPSSLFQRGNPTPLHAPPTFIDPPIGGYMYQNPPNLSHPFYWHVQGDPQDPYSLQANTVGNTVNFVDNPAEPCLPGGSGCNGKNSPPGSYLGFTTNLVGVSQANTPVNLGVTFDWLSTFNGTSGRVATANNVTPVDPGSGTGGITILEIRQTPNFKKFPGDTPPEVPLPPPTQTLTSGTTCNGVFTGTLNGDLLVRSGQSCTLINGTIIGDIQQQGGTLMLSDFRVTGTVKIDGNSSYKFQNVAIENNLAISGEVSDNASTTTNEICGSNIVGHVNIKGSLANVKIGYPFTDCFHNTISGNLTVQENQGATRIFKNIVAGNLNIVGNIGATQVFGNKVSNVLSCTGNNAFVDGANVAEVKQGQCQ